MAKINLGQEGKERGGEGPYDPFPSERSCLEGGGMATSGKAKVTLPVSSNDLKGEGALERGGGF